MEELLVKYDKDIYRNAANGFCICVYNILNDDGEHQHAVICKGTSLPDDSGLYCVSGNWVEDPKYGRQFNVLSYSVSMRSNKADIIEFLSSKYIKGVGKKTAERIYERFGNDTFRIIETAPDSLVSVKGMSKKKVQAISESYGKNKSLAEIYSYLAKLCDISTALCQKIYDRFGHNALITIKQYPYRLCWVKDISFYTADKIARMENLQPDSYERFLAAATYALQSNESEGSTLMELQSFGRVLVDLLTIDREFYPDKTLVNAKVNEMLKKQHLLYRKKIVEGEERYFIIRPIVYDAEKAVAENVCRLSKTGSMYKFKNADKKIDDMVYRLGIKKDPVQFEAVKTAMTNNMSIITGGPGTGKTTIIKIIAKLYEYEYPENDLIFMAPTGRASRKLTESTGYPSSTIHSKLQIWNQISENEDNEIQHISNSLVIVDEMSMVDLWLADNLFKALDDNNKIVLVGDANQLQSVETGAVFRDIIGSKTIPCTELKHIFRQSGENLIIENAIKIKEGNPALSNGKDFEMRFGLRGKDLEDAMVDAYINAVNEYGVDHVACLCPVKDYEAGVNAMNTRLQAIINSPKALVREIKSGNKIYRVGDLVMELENNSEALNGDIGSIINIKGIGKEISIFVDFHDGRVVEYKKDDFARLTLAYAMTVHKAQGSEYDVVITCLQSINKRMQRRSIPYTAFTRAKKRVMFFGDESALSNAILFYDANQRQTMLEEILVYKFGNWSKVAVS